MSVGNLTVNARTGSQVSADLTKIETALTGLKGDADSLYSAEASQITADLSAISDQARALSADAPAALVKLTRTAINEVKRAVEVVTTGMRVDCPSS
jgi:prophage DNA circulation protein